jgi:hypothetical protein
MNKNYLDQLLDKIDFGSEQERADFREELSQLLQDPQLALLPQAPLIQDLLRIYLQELMVKTQYFLFFQI